MFDSRRAASLFTGVGGVLASVALAVRLLGQAGDPVYPFGPLAIGLGLGAAVIALAGAVGLAVSRRGDVGALSALASALVVGTLAAGSVGIFLLPLAGVAVFLLARRLGKGGRLAVAVTSGVAMSVGLIVALLVSSQGPLVDCLPGGGVRSSVPFWWSQSGGSGTSGPDGTARGTIRAGGHTYHYVCHDGRLGEFREG